MKLIINFVLPVILILLISAFTFQPALAQNDDLKNLVQLMEGSYSSEAQSVMDTNFYDIRLHMKKIWNSRTDGYWLYVEQASGQKLDKPYRQRVYHITRFNDSLFESAVYTFENPLRYAGDWKKNNPLPDLTPDSLKSREGCSVFLKKTGDNVYKGRTMGKNCPSDLRGAKYATSEVTITELGIVSWDRGFDETGKQVWGAETGGYNFIKIIE